MSKNKSRVDKNHYRKTSDDGKRSYLYKELGTPIGSFDVCVEIAEHHKDGTTTAYESGNFIDDLFNGGRGRKK